MSYSAFDMSCPLDARYYGMNPEFMARLKPYVSEAGFIKYQARVETALAAVLSNYGIVPPTLKDELKKAMEEITPEEVYREEIRIGHNVRALVNCLKARVSPEARPFIHLCATSNDIIDTANALRLKELTRDVLLPDLIELEKTLLALARRHAETVQIGRTHGQFAIPMTFGYALANYVARIGNRIEHIELARTHLRGKCSGAIGAYNALSLLFPEDPARIEREVLHVLGLRPADIGVSTQVVHPEYVTDLVHAVISTFSVLGNLADDIRHLHRSEIAEVQESYDADRVGSSTMPHKRNPSNFEFVKSMWKAFMPRMTTVYLDQISEHQRDLTNSASGRFVPELSTAFIYAVFRLTTALSRLTVNIDAMSGHVDQNPLDAIIAEPLYILLTANGHPDGYAAARTIVSRARDTGQPVSELMWADPAVRPFLEKLTQEQRDVLDHPRRYLGAAVQQTHVTCDEWEARCERLQNLLRQERQDKPL